ncbi:MAG: 16S rRNA (guanine(527)-N(7))-methyltransferase RsmG [Burkholderiaceae bacterium]|nr:MAG: 16S rRNA (guanine(527)-N(7))-methyltransferase RsmG [Burkholderiaceae bacterium]TAM02813.1 MAG: 16S rRNA (guanine(527)-N(7))-methyltransferase RsmG [Pusillimonas sp.]
MKAGSGDHESRLRRAASTLGIDINDDQVRMLLVYLEQMQRWNRVYNLTALRSLDQFLVQHVFDSLAVLQPLRQELANANVLAEGQMVVDVGSGAGLPGIVLGIMVPQWQVHCVDAVDKKMAFVRQMAGVLGLPNLHALHARIESVAPFNADVVISRAFASLGDFAVLAGFHVSPEGCLLAMKGRKPEEEIAALQQNTDWSARRVDTLVVPELDAQRCLVWMRRQRNP